MPDYKLNIRKFYLDYFKIESRNFSERVAFYENNIDSIGHYRSYDNMEVELDYLICLFEIGKYQKYLEKVDKNIVQIINENIDKFQGRNIYSELLFKKAACLFNTGNLEEAIYITTELIKIEPNEKLYKSFLKKCFRVKFTQDQQKARTSALLILIVIVFVLAIEILVIREFFPALGGIFEIIRNSSFGIAIILLLLHEYQFRKAFNQCMKENLSTKR